MRRHQPVFAVAVAARTQQQHSRQRQPTTHGVHHHRACKIMELFSGQRFDPGLYAEMLIPDNALEEGVDQPDDHCRGDQLGVKTGTLGNAARDDGRNGRRKSQQKEKLHQLIAVFGCQLFGAHKKVAAIGHAVADGKVNNGRDGEVHQNLHQRIDLVFFAHRAELEKCKAGMHGQHHDAA